MNSKMGRNWRPSCDNTWQSPSRCSSSSPRRIHGVGSRPATLMELCLVKRWRTRGTLLKTSRYARPKNETGIPFVCLKFYRFGVGTTFNEISGDLERSSGRRPPIGDAAQEPLQDEASHISVLAPSLVQRPLVSSAFLLPSPLPLQHAESLSSSFLLLQLEALSSSLVGDCLTASDFFLPAVLQMRIMNPCRWCLVVAAIW